MTEHAGEHVDVLLIFPPIYAEHASGVIDEELIRDTGHPFEYPQGVLSIAGYLQSSVHGKPSFIARVLHLDSHIVQRADGKSNGAQWVALRDVDEAACRIAEAAIRRYRPSLVGISVPYYLAEPGARSLAHHLRKQFGQEIKIAVGGQQVSFYDKPHRDHSANRLLEEEDSIDLIIRKEGEFTLQQVMERLSAGEPLEGVLGITYREGDVIHVNPDRPRGSLADIPPLDNNLLLMPDGETIDTFLQKTNVSLVFMRGCPYGKCAFCTSRRWFGVLDGPDEAGPTAFETFMSTCETTLTRLLDHGVRRFQLLDEDIHSYRSYFRELCDMLAQLQDRYDHGFTILAQTRADRVFRSDLVKLRRAGVSLLYVGIETGSVRVLERMNKRIETPLLKDAALVDTVRNLCPGFERLAPEIQQMICACFLIKDAGLRVGAFIMVGHPGSDPAAEAESRELVRLLYESEILDSGDVFEVGIFMPLIGTSARSFHGVDIKNDDPKHWGRMSGRAVCEIHDPSTGEVVFSLQQIESEFTRMKQLTRELSEQAGPGDRWGKRDSAAVDNPGAVVRERP